MTIINRLVYQSFKNKNREEVFLKVYRYDSKNQHLTPTEFSLEDFPVCEKTHPNYINFIVWASQLMKVIPENWKEQHPHEYIQYNPSSGRGDDYTIIGTYAIHFDEDLNVIPYRTALQLLDKHFN